MGEIALARQQIDEPERYFQESYTSPIVRGNRSGGAGPIGFGRGRRIFLAWTRNSICLKRSG
jgi:hypothetical protein